MVRWFFLVSQQSVFLHFKSNPGRDLIFFSSFSTSSQSARYLTTSQSSNLETALLLLAGDFHCAVAFIYFPLHSTWLLRERESKRPCWCLFIFTSQLPNTFSALPKYVKLLMQHILLKIILLTKLDLCYYLLSCSSWAETFRSTQVCYGLLLRVSYLHLNHCNSLVASKHSMQCSKTFLPLITVNLTQRSSKGITQAESGHFVKYSDCNTMRLACLHAYLLMESCGRSKKWGKGRKVLKDIFFVLSHFTYFFINRAGPDIKTSK